ncbi:SRPBCC family protein [Anthocerotibacter panamensis]|uniref:SRPBCC family protein n=1 Tax=Anthocerotibacter panamensis TaxID=2857077 RepID=UPI001C4019BF|nr:SRPBCC family protein [Anthocerotibacter panamensis]
MIERSVELVVQAPVARVYELWSDFENLSRWMRFVDRVTLDPDRPGYSRWRFGIDPLFVEWTARITRMIPLRLVAWESVSGLPNRGQIDFFPVDQSCRLKLTLAVAAPGGVVGAVVEQVGLGRWLDENIRADLVQFGKLVEESMSRDL